MPTYTVPNPQHWGSLQTLSTAATRTRASGSSGVDLNFWNSLMLTEEFAHDSAHHPTPSNVKVSQTT